MGGEQGSRATSPTLTFLFTDIEGHAALWDVHPTEMSGALRDHDAGNQAGIARAREALDRATAIARGLGPQWELLSTLFGVTLAMNASDWARAADGVDAVRRLREEGAAGRTSAWVLWLEAVALVAVGRPLHRTALEARLRGVRRHDAGIGAAVHIEALSAADPHRPRPSIDFDRDELDRATRADASGVLISTAALAARAGDWHVAARLLAGARGRGGIFSSPAGVALYRLLVPRVRAALDKPVRDRLLAEVRQLDISSIFDLAAEWLAQPTD